MRTMSRAARFSIASNSRTRSSASSSISTSLSRMTRNGPRASTCMPGKRVSRNWASTDSSGMMRRALAVGPPFGSGAGSDQKRSTWLGIGTSA